MGVITGLHMDDLKLGLDVPILEILFDVGLKATTPQQAAGYLASPNWSTANPIPIELDATSPASPPHEPPVLKSLLWGFRVRPQIEFDVSQEKQPISGHPAP